MKLKLLLIISLVVLIIISAKPLFNLYESSPFRNYPDGYKSLSVKIDDSTVTYINDERTPVYSDGLPCIGMGSNITVYLSKPWSFNQVYKIKSNSFCVFNQSFELRDVDVDGKPEIYSEWIATAGGSGAIRNIIIWDVNQGTLKPKYKYPQELLYTNQEDKIILTGENGKKEYGFLSIGDSDYYEFKFKNEKLYLDLAYFIWAADEGHFGPHFWKLQRYVLSGDTFVKDVGWNNGKEYTTESKFAVDDMLNAEISSLFEKIR